MTTTDTPRPKRRAPMTEETRERVREMARSGEWSRNGIARELDLDPASVTRICKAAVPPITFDRSVTKAATEARVADLADRRARISVRMLDVADRALDRAFLPYQVVTATKDGAEITTLPEPPAGELRNLMTTAGIAVDKHLAIVKHEQGGVDPNDAAAAVLLRGIAAQMSSLPDTYGQPVVEAPIEGEGQDAQPGDAG